MKYLEEFLEETYRVKPIGELSYADGMECGQFEFLVDDTCTGIYADWQDYAEFLEYKLNNL